MRIALLAAVALASCQTLAPVAVGPDAATQIAVMEQCRAGFGIGGEADYQVDIGPALGGGTTANVLIQVFDRVTPHWMDRINDCAAAQLEIIPLADPVAGGPDLDAPRGTCPVSQRGMYRGTLYCRIAA